MLTVTDQTLMVTLLKINIRLKGRVQKGDKNRSLYFHITETNSFGPTNNFSNWSISLFFTPRRKRMNWREKRKNIFLSNNVWHLLQPKQRELLALLRSPERAPAERHASHACAADTLTGRQCHSFACTRPLREATQSRRVMQITPRTAHKASWTPARPAHADLCSALPSPSRRPEAGPGTGLSMRLTL